MCAFVVVSCLKLTMLIHKLFMFVMVSFVVVGSFVVALEVVESIVVVFVVVEVLLLWW